MKINLEFHEVIEVLADLEHYANNLLKYSPAESEYVYNIITKIRLQAKEQTKKEA